MTKSLEAVSPRNRETRRRGFTLMAALVLGLASAAAAQTGGQGGGELESLQQRRQALEPELRSGPERETEFEREAKSAVKKLGRLRRKSIVAAREIQGAEAELTAIEEELAALDLKERREEAALRRKLAQRREVSDALLRVVRFPPVAMVALRAAPVDTVRGVILSRDLVTTLRNQAADITASIERLSSVKSRKARARTIMIERIAERKNKRNELDRLQVEMAALVDQASKKYHAEVARNKYLRKTAKDIDELIAKLAKPKQTTAPATRREARPKGPSAPVAETAVASIAVPKPPGLHEFTGAKGSLVRPVQGRVVRLYGAKDEFGAASKGIEFESLAAAQVVAPFDGEVVFAGPFRGYGRILLIEHGGGYHTLLAGLGRIDSVPGQWLLAGEPVAVMDDTGPGRPRLYVEFRHRGQPVNPLPWMAAAQNKVSG